MIRGPGDGWVVCALGHRHWGLAGAAGLLLTRVDPDSGRQVLLQHRAPWTHEGDTWGVAGGARQFGESAVAAAIREAGEETGVAPGMARVTVIAVDDHVTWSYRTVVADALVPEPVDLLAAPAAKETAATAWIPVGDVALLRLHPGFAAAWPQLRTILGGSAVVVDAANVIGSVPDGWWRDPTSAVLRLLRALPVLATGGIAATDMPSPAGFPHMEVVPGPGAGIRAGEVPAPAAPAAVRSLERWYPRIDLVVEGRVATDARLRPQDGDASHAVVPQLPDPRPYAAAPGLGELNVIRAARSGDDEIVASCLRHVASGVDRVVVVTADRDLRTRACDVGAVGAGPRWLLGLLAAGGKG